MTHEEKWAEFDKRMSVLEYKILDFEKDVISSLDNQNKFNKKTTLILEILNKKL